MTFQRLNINLIHVTCSADLRTGETLAWMNYIVENYNKLPDHVVFLSDSGPDWHSTADWAISIRTSAPKCRQALGIRLIDNNAPTKEDESALSYILETLANAKYDQKLQDGVCCSESIISRESIRQYPIERYRILRDKIFESRNGSPDLWSYGFERCYAQLFNHC